MSEVEAIRVTILLLWTALLVAAPAVWGQEKDPPASGPEQTSKFRSPEDGWLDVSGFLATKYGFLPLVVPITEPAVDYGAAGGLAFLSKPLAHGDAEYNRPNVTVAAGLGTANGTWGVAVADWRHWKNGTLQTLAGVIHASVNLDFYADVSPVPLRYNLEPTGFMLQAKSRFGRSQFWGGMSYAFVAPRVRFEAPEETPGIPDHDSQTKVGGLTPSLTVDTRDNVFTPVRGSYVEVSAGVFSSVLGGDDEFQRLRFIGMRFQPLHDRVVFGYRGDAAVSFGDAPFYLLPYVSLRGAPALRYQGEKMAQIEAEVRWQFWKRFSLIGFGGHGWAWNSEFANGGDVTTGGLGFRYEIARDYDLHMGLDVAFGPDSTAIYVQAGSAWARP